MVVSGASADAAGASAGSGPRAAWRWVMPTLGLALFVLALVVLRHELRAVSYHELTRAVFAEPASALLLALGLVALNYLVLGGYDLLALRYVGRSLPVGRVLLASFVAYAIQYNVGFGMVSGATVRYRFYSRWGITAGELTRIVAFYSVTFWLGLVVLGGGTLLVEPLPELHGVPGHELARPVGALVLLLAVAYGTAAALRRGPLRLGRLVLPLPAPPIAAGQFLLSLADWVLASAVAWTLLPPGRPSFPLFVGAFLAAQLAAMISHVPGGVGVFETLLVLLLKPVLPAASVLPALVLFRLVYYVLPLALALVVVLADELGRRRAQAARLGAVFGALTSEMTPRLLALFTFLAGAVLLFSGATPAETERLHLLRRLVPLGVIEVSHFVGSLVGVGLLLLSQGVSRRLDASWFLAVGGLVVGVVASLLKGGDYEEALLLTLLLLALVRSRGEFDRKAAFFATRFSPGWVAAVLAVTAAALWLGLFSYRHVDYSADLWWRFELRADVSRFLRASVGVAVALFAFGLSRLLRPGRPERHVPSDAEIEAAGRVIEAQTATLPFLVYLRDKSLIFDPEGTAFLMYAVQGDTWVALGDPVGLPERGPGLVRSFLERCDDFDGTPVFYQVTRERLHLYADYGLTFGKLGEEARVDLGRFSLEGGASRGLRKSHRRLEKEGCAFRVLTPAEVSERIGELQEVSADWLRQKEVGEKGFSLGFFDPAYVAGFPAAVVERGARVEAFATVWPGPGGEEVSVDLMRYRESAPPEVMEALFVHLLLWGQSQGYRWFSLGMAPLSGLESSPVAPLWNRLGAFLYEHGEAFYNFQGLRAFKEKFHPTWQPRYLAFLGGLGLARVLADVSALIAGGYRRIFRR
jgi:phosphatidylglycerol lysyltransferase